MPYNLNRNRRDFLQRAGLALAAIQCDMAGVLIAAARDSRELTALGRAAEWINSPRLDASTLRGRVVLVHFWTYTCINWLRALPYIRAWAGKYPRLAVVGVHTPEFPFERNVDNVRRASDRLGLEFPIAIDNDSAIWRAFRNQAWPALYLLDAAGQVRRRHFGEGEYAQSEGAIQELLAERDPAGGSGRLVSIDAGGVEAPADWANLKSPETYIGHQRATNFASPGGADIDRRRVYAAPARLALNQWWLAGEWTIGERAAALRRPNGRIGYRFHARDVHLVMGPVRPGMKSRFRVTLDGQAPGAAHGLDTNADGSGVVIEPRLYQLVRQPGPIVDRTFDIEFLDPDVEAFAFTFG